MEEENLEFKIHKNINFKPKVFGIFEKKSFILTMIASFILIKVLDFFKINSILKLEIIIMFLIPNLLLSANSLMYESPVYTLKYLLNYLFSKKVYLYEREYMYNKKNKNNDI